MSDQDDHIKQLAKPIPEHATVDGTLYVRESSVSEGQDQIQRAWFARGKAEGENLLGICEQRLRSAMSVRDTYAAELAAAQERIRELEQALQAALAHRGVWLHDAGCFSMDGSKPCICGREELHAKINSALHVTDKAAKS